jgi:hypothetical protein
MFKAIAGWIVSFFKAAFGSNNKAVEQLGLELMRSGHVGQQHTRTWQDAFNIQLDENNKLRAEISKLQETNRQLSWLLEVGQIPTSQPRPKARKRKPKKS